MSVIRGVGSVRQCFSEENYSVHKPFKEEAAYINMQLVFVNSCPLFTSTPWRYVLESHDASLCHALHLSPCPLLQLDQPLVESRALLQGYRDQTPFCNKMSSFLRQIPRSPCWVRLGPGPLSALCSGKAYALVVECQPACEELNMGRYCLRP